MVDLRYRKILLTVDQWVSRKSCLDWETLLTAKAISGRVIDKYCNAPIVLQYNVISENWEPKSLPREALAAIGEIMGLACIIFILAKMPEMYLCCDSNKPAETRVIARPRKKFKSPRSLTRKSKDNDRINEEIVVELDLAKMISST